MTEPTRPEQEFQRERFQAEKAQRERELDLQERELDFKMSDARRSRWSNPLVIAIIGAMLAALGNIFITYRSGIDQRILEDVRQRATQTLEKQKAESQLILEMIKTANPDKAAENLEFLLNTHLITEEAKRAELTTYLKSRPRGTGATLPTAGPSTPLKESGVRCRSKSALKLEEAKKLVEAIFRAEPYSVKTIWLSIPSDAGSSTSINKPALLAVGHSVVTFLGTFVVTHTISRVPSFFTMFGIFPEGAFQISTIFTPPLVDFENNIKNTYELNNFVCE